MILIFSENQEKIDKDFNIRCPCGCNEVISLICFDFSNFNNKKKIIILGPEKM